MSLARFSEAMRRRGLDVDASSARELYGWLRDYARRHRRRHGGGLTLCTTALVHEAWLRLFDGNAGKPFESRGHFLATAALAMRCLLVDHLRRESRGLTVMAALAPTDDPVQQAREGADVLALHEALERLAEVHERAARSVELRFFAGLTESEAAEALGVTERTVRRDWNFARAWLGSELGHGD